MNKDEGLQVSIPTRGNTLFRGSSRFDSLPTQAAVSIPTRGNTLFRGVPVGGTASGTPSFQSPLGETPCSGSFGHVHQITPSEMFQSPLGETPCSGKNVINPTVTSRKQFQSPLGETPCSGHLATVKLYQVTAEFQSPLGETPCSGRRGDRLHRTPPPRVSIPTRGNTLFRDTTVAPGRSRVSIPTRGNTLFRGAGVQHQRDWIPEFQSPLGETPCSGWLSRPTRPQRSRRFQSPLGETPCSGG